MKMNSRGFTLIELLVVIAIIGILAGIVIVSLTSAQDRAQRTSTLATLKSVVPELVTCQSAGGTTSAMTYGAGNTVCAGQTGFSTTWPTLSNSWAYGTTSGSIAAGNLSFTATKAGQTPITCTMSTGVCN